MALVAHQMRFHVFVGLWILLHGGRMKATLVGKGRFADVRCMTVRLAIQPFVQHPRDLCQLRQVVVPDIGLVSHLQHEGWNYADQVGVTAALSQPVDGALYLARAGANARERVGHRVARVVVEMDPNIVAGNLFADSADDIFHFVRQRAAVGIA